MGSLVQIAWRNLLQHRRRSLLLGGAIAIVTMLLVTALSLLNGIQATMLRNGTTLSTGHVNVAGFYKLTAGNAAPLVTKYTALKEVVRASTPGLDYMVARGRGFGKLVSDQASLQSVLTGIDIGAEAGFKEIVQLAHGDIARLAEPRTLLLFETQAERLQVKVGDNITVSSSTFRGVNNTVDVRLVAIARDLGMLSSFTAYVHHGALRDLYELDDQTTGALQVYLHDADEADRVAPLLRAAIEKAGYRVMEPVPQPFWRKFDTVKREDWTGQKIDVTTWTDELMFMQYTLKTLRALIAVVVSVLLVIIVVGVMNTLWMSIRERTREIGALRAIGMQRGRVLWMFLIEVALLATGATAAGAALALALCAAINAARIGVPKAFQMFTMSDVWRLVADGGTVAGALATITVITTLGALFPAWRASQLQPVKAMQSAN